jgi:tetratricopeptide (TPR) repeat protein
MQFYCIIAKYFCHTNMIIMASKIQFVLVIMLITFKCLSINVPKMKISKRYHNCNEAKGFGTCPHDYKKDYNESIKSLRNGQINKALTLINTCLKKAEEQGVDMNKLYYLKAQILAAKNNYKGALEEIGKATAESNALYYYNKAVYACKDSSYSEAINDFKNHLENKNTLKSECYLGIGYSYFKLGKLDEAFLEYEQSVLIKDNLSSRLGMIQVLFAQDLRINAVKLLQETVKKYPKNSELKAYLANCLLNEGNTKKASKLACNFNRKKSYTNLVCLGNLNFKLQNYKVSESKYKIGASKKPNISTPKIGLLNDYFAENKFKQFTILKGQLKEIDSLNPILLELFGLSSYKNGNYGEALGYFRKADSTKCGYRLSYDALLSSANVYLKYNSIKEATILFERAISRSDKNAHAHAGLGFCIASNTNFIFNKTLYTKANEHFKKALEKEPNNPIFLSYLGITEYLMDNYKKSEMYLEKAIAIQNNDPTIYNSLAMTYSKLNKFNEAKDAMKKARSLDPTNNKYYINSGIIETEHIEHEISKDTTHSTIEELSRINNYYDLAIKYGADSNITRINRGYAYFKANKSDSAILFYNQVNHTDSLLIAGRENNKGVVNAINFSPNLASLDFNRAKALDKENEYPFIEYNQELLAEDGDKYLIKRKNKYISLVYYYLPMTEYELKLHNNLNVPENPLLAASPNELIDAGLFLFNCNSHYYYKLVVIKSKEIPKVSRNPFAHCSSKTICKN